MARAFTFPGQGSQAVGMGKDLAEAFGAAREVFEEIDDALSDKLSKLMFEGPIEDLTLTQNAQPAIMGVSLAVVRVLKQEFGVDIASAAQFVAGHSLGEYSALAAADAIDLTTTARLLRRRGEAMQRAVPVGEGAMSALLGIEPDQAAKVTAEAVEKLGSGAVCAVANDNGGGQVVISGSAEAVKTAGELAVEQGAKRAMPLPVSAPFHCSLMQPAADEMAEALEQVTIAPPKVPVIANVTVEPVSDPAQIQALLVEQVTAMVRWRETISFLKPNGVETAVEVGAGKILTGMAKRIDRELTLVNVGTPDQIEDFAKSL